MYDDVIGENPKKVFGKLKMNLQFFANKTYEKWLKDEILSLDELDIDKAMMKDASNKNVTPTTLYKKYIGDNPMQDYTLVSEYEKGTKDSTLNYINIINNKSDKSNVLKKYDGIFKDKPHIILKTDNRGLFEYSLVSYAGRRYPVSYYGTHIDETSKWSTEIPKNDKETLYALRRLSIYTGDAYVREPSGLGYWARVNVTFSQKHCELTIPVEIDITRVEGGI